ncbi:MAG: bile acid:sodium symporter family protein [Mangrovibacterium sp.]
MFKKIDLFIVCLIAILVISAFIPQWFVSDWHRIIGIICNVGITLIFFIYGLKMNKQDITKGLANYKLHILIQTCTFVLFPLMALAMKPIFAYLGMSEFWISFLFLAALPSTVSSSVVMVSIAKGNVPAAIFNASLSGLIGVIATPLWMNFSNGANNFLETLYHLCLTILLPVLLGLLLNQYFGDWAKQRKKQLGLIDKTIILLIVFNSFSEAFSSGLFTHFSLRSILLVGIFTILMLFGVYLLIWFISKLLHFNIEDRITACFCGSKKSLMHGSVMVQAMFKNTQTQALILLPIMIFHSVQLIVISFIAQRYAERKVK